MKIAGLLYLINVLSGFRVLCRILVFMICVVIVGDIIWYAVNSGTYLEEERDRIREIHIKYKKEIKKILAVFVVSILGLVFIPSKNDMYLLVASTQISTKNYNWTKNEVKEIIDYSVKSFKQIKEDGK
ncbi:hypothetical protein [Peptostreptococcus equinus]|uniref:Uncharacterized protein n=2 Tax=Peptostreptococcus equinus TaxID=3003601 RepID=A0ABY7JS00_9FIRM|nr:hypothetical protein [Peptostreptococcus sp. CBA3647]WAW15271.1 hypothetical protein O0R46_02130 [Peptostreptococcus sp. CBA3647]